MARIASYHPTPHHLSMRGDNPIKLNANQPSLAHAPAVVNPPGSGHPELGAPDLQPPHIAQAIHPANGHGGRMSPYRKIVFDGRPAHEHAGPVKGGVGPGRNIVILAAG